MILKNSIRAGAALGAAIALAEVLPLEHGFWVALGALSILRSSASSTYACARQAIVGTVIGFIVAAIVALTVGDNEAVLWIILPIVTFLAGYTPGAMHFAAGQAAFTVLVVVLFGLLGSPDLETDVLRIETISVGAFTAVALSLVIWPRGARVAIARTVAQVYRLAGAAASTFVTGDNDARAEAELDLSDALRRAEAAFGAALAEHSEPLDPAAWVTVMQPAIVTRALTLGLLPSVEHATTRDHARACPTHNDERPVCRLFGMTAGSRPVSATFWLLDAPDSLESQGRRNRDGTGLGYFTTSGRPVVDKQPEPAYSDVEFIRDARVEASTTFVAHVRVATASSLRVENTHPFEMEGRIMAHNGGFEQIELVEAELGPDLARVQGDTDSERYFALITKRIAERDGDVSAGVADAVRWLAENVPLYSLNLVLATENQLWALRYPEHHHLYVLRRPLIDPHGRTFRAVSPTMRVAATELGMGETVVVASEPMDEKSDWRLMDPGELMHVSADLEVDSQIVISEPPALRSVDPLPYVP